MKFLRTLIAPFLLFIGHATADPLEVGAEVPAVKSVLDQDGTEIDLDAALAEGTALVYFYPKANTPGCTKQACNLRDAFEKLTEAGIKVYGVSTDKPEAQKKFQADHRIPFTLLADHDEKVCTAFGVGMMAMGFAMRQSFLVRDGKVIWRDLTATPTTQAEDALAAAKAE